MWKFAAAMGSALPDPVKSEAAAAPVPSIAVPSKPPAGQRGPAGIQPRATYSRVNTPRPPKPDAGEMGQKSVAPRGAESLPKVAEARVTMSSTTGMNIHDLLKAASAGAAEHLDLNLRHARRVAGLEVEKTAAAAPPAHAPTIDTAQALAIADALDWVKVAMTDGEAPPADPNMQGTGVGANASSVHITPSGENKVTGNNGTASAAVQPPMSETLESDPNISGDAATHVETKTTIDGAPPVIENGTVDTPAKMASLYARNLTVLGLKLAEDEAGPETVEAPPADAEPPAESTEGGMGAELPPEVAALLAQLGVDPETADPETIQAILAMLQENQGGTEVPPAAETAGEPEMEAPVGDAAAPMEDPKVAALYAHNLRALGFHKEAASAHPQSRTKQSSVPVDALIELAKIGHISPDGLVALLKLAGEETLAADTGPQNAGGQAVAPEGVRDSSEPGPAKPADVEAQVSKMLSSNEAAINTTQRDAKADVKEDLSQILNESALSRSGDSVLQDALKNTEQAGSKISSLQLAALQVLAEKRAAEDCAPGKKDSKKGKEKTSMMAGMAPPPPPPPPAPTM